eukprot:3872050-Pyramimonas_sp.AAC.1
MENQREFKHVNANAVHAGLLPVALDMRYMHMEAQGENECHRATAAKVIRPRHPHSVSGAGVNKGVAALGLARRLTAVCTGRAPTVGLCSARQAAEGSGQTCRPHWASGRKEYGPSLFRRQ